MKEKRYFYLIKVQFLGFRYSGWQKQPGHRTIEGMLLKTLRFVLPNRKCKILGAGRTDAKVSALDAAFELFLEGSPIDDLEDFISLFNKNLPPDIKAVSIKRVDNGFNVIKNAKIKEYVYLFAFGEKSHPFCSPFLCNVQEQLDIDLMKRGSQLFMGTHSFKTYTARPKENTQFVRTIIACTIEENTLLRANFFPEKSYLLRVSGKGFNRYQIRMMMGVLIQLGMGEVSLLDIENSLVENSTVKITYVAPGSGLLLNRLEFD